MSKTNMVRKLAFGAILVALQIILSRYLGIQTDIFQISLGFVPIAIAAMMLGPSWAVFIALVSDFVGTMIAGTGAYNPMFSINAVLYALIFAWMFYKKDIGVWRVVVCVMIQLVFVAVPLTPLWLYIYHKYVTGMVKAFSVIFTAKLTASLIEAAVKVVVLIPVCKYLYPRLSKVVKF
ncbi:MAG: folate family ECF transporter S component [Ruminococcaceae bacterium]|nr:folate family ECF transporter S component [Oscillospiraceae bacterium]